MMSSAQPPDLLGPLRAQQHPPPNAQPSTGPQTAFTLSTQLQPTQSLQQPPTAAPLTPVEPRTLDPTFEPLERAGRALNNEMARDERFPGLDNLVQRSLFYCFAYGRGCQ